MRRTPRTAPSWRAPTSRTPSTASSRTAAVSAGSSASASADGGVRMAALPAAGDASVEAFRAVALKGVDADVKLELTARSRRGRGRRRPAPPTSSRSRSGTEIEEYDGLSVKKGRAYIVTKVNAASKLIKLEETGGSRPRRRARPRQLHALDAEAGRRIDHPVAVRGRRRQARGHGRPGRGRRGHDADLPRR